MEPYAIIQESILVCNKLVKQWYCCKRHRSVAAIFVSGNFGLFRWNPWQPLAKPWLENTALGL